MAACGVCGNEYDKAFVIRSSDGSEHNFDAFECAIHALAPICAHCDCRVIGHGVEAGAKIFCCAHCAAAEGEEALVDRAG